MENEKTSEQIDKQNDTQDNENSDETTSQSRESEVTLATDMLNGEPPAPSEEEAAEPEEKELISQTPTIVDIDEQLIADSVAAGVGKAMHDFNKDQQAAAEAQKEEVSEQTTELVDVGEQVLAIDHQITTGDMLLSTLIACNIAVILITRIIRR